MAKNSKVLRKSIIGICESTPLYQSRINTANLQTWFGAKYESMSKIGTTIHALTREWHTFIKSKYQPWLIYVYMYMYIYKLSYKQYLYIYWYYMYKVGNYISNIYISYYYMHKIANYMSNIYISCYYIYKVAN